MIDLSNFDFEKTIRDFDYTRRASSRMFSVVESEDFEEMDAEMIFDYLYGQMEMISFGDYLKRYVYEKAEIDAPFKSIPEEIYVDIIVNSFKENRAPFTFSEKKKKPGTTVKTWLSQDSVRRENIFMLGFGLNMPAEDVSEFLIKVIREEDFDFEDEKETVIWYCLKKGISWNKCRSWLERLENEEFKAEGKAENWEEMRKNPELFLLDENNLWFHVSMLKSQKLSEQKKKAAFLKFEELYDRCRRIIAEDYNDDFAVDKNDVKNEEDIKPADVERVLCSGIPVTEGGNLKKMSASQLEKQFRKKRMSRQRITGILNGKHPVERFDLITLLFFIYACRVEPNWPAERFLKFLEDINQTLFSCRMLEIYPANPYESFVLMCLLAEDPMDVYAQIWEKSYEEEE